ncbi:hypothetical protein GCM10009665_59310 [Kitasatospora nipponensis]|uniref:Uncharacterized protein n=1 Tax=Kitasatospora nipponensis TaxID=258049 RepID=A0ABN1WRH1_9ACTN
MPAKPLRMSDEMPVRSATRAYLSECSPAGLSWWGRPLVTGLAGAVVGSASLDTGRSQGVSGYGPCSFAFTVAGVPEGARRGLWAAVDGELTVSPGTERLGVVTVGSTS